MAILGSFVVVTNVTGAVAGMIFGKGISGPTLRKRALPLSTKSTAQQGVQNVMASATAAASALTTDQVAAWQTWANTQPRTQQTSGATYYPSWQNAFIQVYINWTLANGIGSPPSTPPGTPFTDDEIGTVWTSTAPGTLTVTASGPNYGDNVTGIYFGKYHGLHASPQVKRLRFQGILQFTADMLSYTFTDLPANQVYTAAIREIDKVTGAGGTYRDIVLTATSF